jgi:hypothetical protein
MKVRLMESLFNADDLTTMIPSGTEFEVIECEDTWTTQVRLFRCMLL